MRTATVTIDAAALAHNLQVIKSQLQPDTKVLAMVKADAYGHGVDKAVPALIAADGFGVACMSEALAVEDALRAVDTVRPVVLIEGVFSRDEWLDAIAHDFGCVIHHDEQLHWALEHKPSDNSFCCTIWLKYNTGMNRIGFGADEIIDKAKLLIDAGYQIILTSHFACSDEKEHPLNAVQIERFNHALQAILQLQSSAQGSLCNSAGIFNFPQVHHNWVRAGIALYGAKPVAHCSAADLGLLPAMTLSAKIMAIHTLNAGDSVGYAALWSATDAHKIAIVSIGYGDGYPRVVDGAKVSIISQSGTTTCAIIGRVAMDMLMIDVDGVDVAIGDDVILWGDAPHIDEVAMCANTIGYELMCRLTTRPNRQLTNK